MKFNKLLYLIYFFFLLSFLTCCVLAQVSDVSLWSPQDLSKLDEKENLPSQIDIEKIPSNVPSENYDSSNKRIRIGSVRTLTDERLKLTIDCFIDLKKSMVGDYFKAYTQEDFYSSLPVLTIPKGSWLRGHISYIRKPNILLMSGKLKINLDQLVTPYGEITPLISSIDIQQGIPGENGLLNPMTRELPLIGSLPEGLLVGLTPQFNLNGLVKGQELQIIIKQ